MGGSLVKYRGRVWSALSPGLQLGETKGGAGKDEARRLSASSCGHYRHRQHDIPCWQLLSHLIDRGIDFFDDEIWDRWIPTNLISLVPGALEFLTYCKEQGVEVFYVTSRDQGAETYNYALRQLQYLALPFADSEHLTVFKDSSDKTPARESVKRSHELILLLGDNLNDFKRDYYVANIEQRFELMERDRQEFGDRFIVLPNLTDGHWVRAIFGESEPAPTIENRSILWKPSKKARVGRRIGSATQQHLYVICVIRATGLRRVFPEGSYETVASGRSKSAI